MKKTRNVVVILLLAMLLVLAGCITKAPQKFDDGNQSVVSPKLVDAVINSAAINNNGELLTNSMMLNENDRVWVIVETTSKSLADHYLDEKVSADFKDYALTENARQILTDLTEEQNYVMSLVQMLDSDVEFSHQYTSILSGFAAEVRYGDIADIENLPFVARVIVSEEYAQLDTSANEIMEMMEETGIFSNESEYQGDGMLIAVLDNGLDYTHSAFQTMPEVENLTYSDVENLIDGIWGVATKGKTFTAAQIYKSAKIPFQFDYSGVDADVKTNSTSIKYYGTFHGTHVSGISVGNDDTIKGAAPNAQLAFMKVFGDYATGGKTTDIVAALGDCAYLGVDALNMSLGATAGFTFERAADQQYVNEMYGKLEQLGILVCCASGNETNSSLVYENNYVNAANPDIGLVSNPGSFDAAFAVASNNRVATSVFYADGKAMTFEYPVDMSLVYFDIESMLYAESDVREFELVLVPGFGVDADYEGIDVTGKAVLVKRGETTLEAKQEVAAAHGAAFCIIYNNEVGRMRAQMNDVQIPTVTVQWVDGLRLLEAKSVKFVKGAGENMISSFSSWGCLSDLTLKPDITAPGGSIYSSMPNGYEGGLYAYLSGTSMATPNLTGLITVVKQYVRENFVSATELEIRNLTYQLIQSTATQIVDEGGNLASPRAQGAGVANLNNALATRAYLSVTGTSRAKIELGDDKNRDGIYTLRFNVTNFGDTTLTYRPEVSTFTDTLNPDGETIALRSMLLDQGTVEVKSEAMQDGYIVVEAGETAAITMIITLSEDEKAYLDKSFVNGMFIEGFAFLRAEEGTTIDLSIPFLGFYGDWTEAPIFDATAYDDEEPIVYGSRVYGYYGTYQSYYPMGMYDFFTPESADTEIPEADYNRIALTCNTDGVYEIYAIYMANFRAMSYLEYSLYDAETGYVYFTHSEYNVRKMYYTTDSGIIVAGHPLYISAEVGEYDFASNQRLVLAVDAYLDVDGEHSHNRLEFPIYLDFEKPLLEDGEIREEDGRVYVDVDVFDNHILDHMLLCTPQAGSNTLILLNDNATPVLNFVQGQTNRITIDVTDLIPNMYDGKFYIAFEDCAMNQSIYYIGDFSEYQETEGDNEQNSVPTSFDYETVKEWLITEKGVMLGDELPEEVIKTLVLSEIEALTYQPVVTAANGQVYERGEHKFTVNDYGYLIKYEGPGGHVEIPGDIGIKTIMGSVDVFRGNTTITSVVVPEGVVTIDGAAFYMCSNLTSITLSSTIKTYGANCFRASGLVELEIPEGGETFGSSFLCECRSLEKVTFPSTAKGVFPSQAVAWSVNLKELYIPDGFTTCGSQPLAVCISLEKLRISPNMTALVNYFAVSCWKLREANLEDLTKLKEWNQSAFSHCDLRDIVLPANEDGLQVKMGAGLFDGNLNIEHFTCYADINRFNTVTDNENKHIKTVDFYGNIQNEFAGTNFTCSPELEYVNFYGDVGKIGNKYQYEFSFSNSGLKSVHFYGNVGEITGTNFSNCPNLEEVVFHKSIGAINNFPFGNNPKLKYFTLSEDNVDMIFDAETKIVYNNDKTKMFVPSGWDYDGVLEIPETITSFQDGQFGASGKYLEDIILTRTYSESGTTTNGSMIHPDNEEVKPLLKGVIIPATVTSIPQYAFRSFTGLKTVEFKGEIKSIGNYAFANCGIEELVLPEGLTTIGQYAFYNNTNLKSVIFSDKVTTVNTYAFAECTSLANVEFNDALTAVQNYAFKNTVLEALNIPSKVAIFNPLTVLKGVNTLKTIEVAEDNNILASVDNVLFNKNITILYKYNSASDRAEYAVPATVTEIMEYAFDAATSLREVDLGNVNYIYEYAFYGSGLNNLSIPGTVSYIGTRAFAEMKLATLKIANETNLFDYSYVFRNTAIENIEIENNKFFKVEGDFVLSTDGKVLYDYFGGAVETLAIPEGVRRIAPYAFKNIAIENVVLNESLISIGTEAFYGCGLKTVTFKSVNLPRFECEYDATNPLYYKNFGDVDVEVAPTIKAIFPANASYLKNLVFSYLFTWDK